MSTCPNINVYLCSDCGMPDHSCSDYAELLDCTTIQLDRAKAHIDIYKSARKRENAERDRYKAALEEIEMMIEGPLNIENVDVIGILKIAAKALRGER
jgi:hypothetical protein